MTVKLIPKGTDAAPILQNYILNCMVSGETKRIGKFYGFDVSVKRESNILGSGGVPFIVLQHNKGLQHSAELTLESDMGSITRIENVLKIEIDKMLNNLNTQLGELESNLKEARETKDLPFEFTEELNTKAARLEQLNCELNFDKPDDVVMIDDEDKDNPDLNEKKTQNKDKPKR